MKTYLPRLTDGLLREKLATMPAVLVRGPKWCGKTSSCEQEAASALKLRDPDVRQRSLDAAAVKVSLLLRGERPRLLDEWQVIPALWDAVTHEADEVGGVPGQFLLTGSATPVSYDEITHTGAGRIARLDMSTMTLQESGESSAEVSLASLFTGDRRHVEGHAERSVEDYAHIICRGGWPALVAQKSQSTGLAADYVDAIVEADLAEAAERAVDPVRARGLLQSLSRLTAQEAALSTVLAGVRDLGVEITEPTLRRYLSDLRRLFIVQELPAWAPTLRSRTPLRQARVWHLCEPSLAAASLGVDPDGLLDDLTTMGFLFESLCVHDVRVYAQLLGGTAFHYRDKSGLEVDIIVRLPSGEWAGIEVKLGGPANIDQAAENLLSLRKKVDDQRSGTPAFLMVLTAGEYAYTREDGVHVVPLACLAA